MLLMTHMAALRALLDRAREPAVTSDSQAPVSSGAGEANAAAPEPCDSDVAADDFAALREGNLSPTGLARLSDHVAQCVSCQILVAFMIRQAHSVEASDIIRR
jgi:hypothetical protein